MNKDEFNNLNSKPKDNGIDIDKEAAELEKLLFGITESNEKKNDDNIDEFSIESLFAESEPKTEAMDEAEDDVVTFEPEMPKVEANDDVASFLANAEPTFENDVADDEKSDGVSDSDIDDNIDIDEFSSVKEEDEDEVDIPSSSYRSGNNYDSFAAEGAAPVFFTESSSYDDEKPLDISDFYPPEPKIDMAEEQADGITDENTYAEGTYDIAYGNIEEIAPAEDQIAEFAPEVAEETFDEPETDPFDEDMQEYVPPVKTDDEIDTTIGATAVFDPIKTDDIIDDIGATREFKPEDIKEVISGMDETREFHSLSDADKDGEIEKMLDKQDSAKSGDADEKDEKKPNGFVRFLKGIFPWKGDSGREIARKLVFIVAFITLIAMLWQIVFYYVIEPMNNSKLTKKLVDDYYQTQSTDYSNPQMNPKFAALYEENPDLVGWIKIDGINVDYPVVQGDDNDEYKRADFDKNYSRYGSIFMDSDISIEYGQESKNLVVYGHNMKDDKSMFSQLLHYRDIEHYKKYPTFTFDTLYNDGTWKIFAIMTTNAYAAQDNGEYFDFRKNSFASDDEFNQWISDCRFRSCINTTVDVLPTDTVLTLQTCAYEFSDARFVVMARRTRADEDKAVDTNNASVNTAAKYPQAWYDAKGLSNPYLNGTYYTAPITTVPVTDEQGSTVNPPATVTETNAGAVNATPNGSDDDNSSYNSNSSNSGSSSGGSSSGGSSTTKPNKTEATKTPTEDKTEAPNTDETDAPTEEPTEAPTEAPNETPDPEPTPEPDPEPTPEE